MCKFLLLLSLLCIPTFLVAQIDLNDYKSYMEQHENSSYQDLLNEFDVGTFERYCPTNYSKAYYFDSTNQFMNFTPDELQLIKENGFVVTQRKEVENYIKGYYDIYVNDLPVYISADMFNHALFYTMTKTMKLVETSVLSNKLYDIISDITDQIHLYSTNSQDEKYLNAGRDLDVIFCVAQNLQHGSSSFSTPNYTSDLSFSTEITEKILSAVENNDGDMVDINLPSGLVFKKVDLSQYKPRGHYNTEELKNYFMTMMWLGRLFLPIPEKEKQVEINKSSIIMSGILADIVNNKDLMAKYEEFDNFLQFYISAQNNLTVKEVSLVYQKLNVKNMAEVVDNNLLVEYCKELRSTNKGVQLYNTQCVYDMEFEDDGQSPQYFSLFGQRPTVDAFVFGNVVFPMIKGGVRRMLPESMDILFSLGNDAAYHLLDNEVNKYQYAQNIASCRYLFDNMEEEEWESSLYNLWIQALRTLNPPKDRSDLPKFMQAAAWQHKNMNTQLASWAELRHLTVLYVKQSYTGIPLCDFPDFFIEPRPEYFNAMGKINKKIIEMMELMPESNSDVEISHQYFMFSKKQEIFEKLEDISRKQYSNKKLSNEDIEFLKDMIFDGTGESCINFDIVDGWIYRLFNLDYDSQYSINDKVGENLQPTKVTTDVHTSPSDEFENIVGWVKHAATGDQNYCTIVTDNYYGNPTAYTGVVNSYFEYITDNFQRDTDEEWLAKMDQIQAPSFTNVYRADKYGNKSVTAELVKTHDVSVEDKVSVEDYSINIYPNIFENDFTVSIQSKENYEGVAQIAMYSSTGELVFKAEYNNLPSGQIVINPSNYGLANLTAGVYIIELKIGDNIYTGKAIKIK